MKFLFLSALVAVAFVSRSVSGYFRFLERVKKLLVRSTSDLVRMDFGCIFRNCYMINGKF